MLHGSNRLESINLERYLNFLGLTRFANDENTKPSFNLLRAVVNSHCRTIPYQNYELTMSEKIDLSMKTLQEKLIRPVGNGGHCCELSELLCEALSALRFDVKRLLVYRDYNSVRPIHSALLVFFENKIYLVDVGFGLNAIREPLEFSFKKTEERTVQPDEVYRLVCEDNMYTFEMRIDGNWMLCYRFERPFRFYTSQEIIENMHELKKNPSLIPEEAMIVRAGIVTPNGRIGYSFEYDKANGKPLCKLIKMESFQRTQTEIDFKQYCLGIQPFVAMEVQCNRFPVLNFNV